MVLHIKGSSGEDLDDNLGSGLTAEQRIDLAERGIDASRIEILQVMKEETDRGGTDPTRIESLDFYDNRLDPSDRRR